MACSVCCAHLPSSSSAKRSDRWLALTERRADGHGTTDEPPLTDEDEDEDEESEEAKSAVAAEAAAESSSAEVHKDVNEQCWSGSEEEEEERSDEREDDTLREAVEQRDEVDRLAEKHPENDGDEDKEEKEEEEAVDSERRVERDGIETEQRLMLIEERTCLLRAGQAREVGMTETVLGGTAEVRAQWDTKLRQSTP